jgi:ankyrin repeat protein
VIIKKLILLLPAFLLCFASGCGGKKEKPLPEDLWYKNEGFVKSVQLSDADGTEGVIATTTINLNARDEEGRTALLYAIDTTFNESVIAAIAQSAKADLSARDNRGYDALTFAAAKNPNEEVLLALLMAGASPADNNAFLDAAYKNTNIAVPNMVGRYIMKTPWDKNAAFIEALQKGDFAKLRRELPFTDIHKASAPQSRTPLLLSFAGKDRAVIDLLIKAGANPNEYAVAAQKVMPLHLAAAKEPLIIADALLKNGSDVNAQDANGYTPLMLAVKQHPDSHKAVALLIKNNADVNLSDKNGDTALIIAAQNNADETNIKQLIAAGASTEAKNNKGETALSVAAAYSKNPAIIIFLVREKADINTVDTAGFSPLAKAALMNPDEKITQALIDAGADSDFKVKQAAQTPQPVPTPEKQKSKQAAKPAPAAAQPETDFTPLMLAVARNTNDKVPLALINAGADKGDLKLLAQYAAQNDKCPQMKDLVTSLEPPPVAGAAPTTINSKSPKVWYNNDAFGAAVEKGDVKALRMALGGGVNIQGMYSGGRSISALMYAAAHTQNEEILTTLIKAGANVNTVNENGDTALMVAALVAKNPKIIDVLIQAGADVNARDRGGVSALVSAAANNPNEAVILALIRNGADTKNIGALLEAAAKNPNPKIKETLQKTY